MPDSVAGARVRVTLNPAHLGGRWCAGRFHGQIEELQAPVCPRGEACPAYVAVLATIGKFGFRVD